MIIRVEKKRNPFVVIDKTCLNDTRITWQAKGLLAYLLSKPDNWKPIRTELIKAAKNGDTSVRSILKELEQTGYMKRKPVKNDKGVIEEWEQVVYETPVQVIKNPDVENPHVDRAPLISNDLINNESNKTYSQFDFEFDAWWDKYPNKKGKTDALRNWKKLCKQGITVEQLIQALDNYKRETNGKDKQYIMHGSTFLGPGERWKDYLQQERPASSKPKEDEQIAELRRRGG